MSNEEYPHGVLREDDEVTIMTKDPEYFPGDESLVDYLWSLPLWRRALGFRLYVFFRDTAMVCGTACGYVALMLVSGYPWNKQRRMRRRQKYSDEI